VQIRFIPLHYASTHRCSLTLENDKVQNRKQYVPCLMYGKRANGAAMIVQIVSHVDIARHGPYN
jgi:hypothetical protein